MKFLCLAYEDQADLDKLSQDEWLALRSEVLEYVAKLEADGYLVSTNALKSASTAATVRVRDGRTLVTDGPFAEAKEVLGGYFLIEAPDRDEAVAIASRWPSARFGAIEVRPVEEALREDRRY
jgi:hypothetical protein